MYYTLKHQAKFGVPVVAEQQLEVFLTSVLMATKAPPRAAKHSEWRELMEHMSRVSCDAYRAVVFKHPHFIDYFRNATPEEELGNLNIGSRPARRRKGGGVETLRAIPWIFAWYARLDRSDHSHHMSLHTGHRAAWHCQHGWAWPTQSATPLRRAACQTCRRCTLTGRFSPRPSTSSP